MRKGRKVEKLERDKNVRDWLEAMFPKEDGRMFQMKFYGL
jgi:hypothetical protein